jgi:gliding motility-associated-like protein
VPVRVNAIPNASFTQDVLSGCSVLTVHFTNTSVAGQPDVIDRFVWEVDDHKGLGFQPVVTKRPSDPGFSNLFTHDFENVTTINQSFEVRLHTVTVNSCERISTPVTLTVFPGTRSGFISTNYSPFNDNCSPQTVNFSVDNQTQSLNPTDYTWKVKDSNGLISSTSTGTTPSFRYSFSNSTQALKDFFVTLHTTLPSGCFGDSTRTIRISPVPSSVFTIDTLAFDCKIMRIRMSAAQKGLPQYHWIIKENGITVSEATSTRDIIEFQFNRPAPASSNISVQVNLDTKNFANCVSVVSSQTLTVPRQDAINASFTANPVLQSFPGSTVTITNTTSPGPWQYSWDFGDGNTSTVSDPSLSHTYAIYGTYVISLKVTNNVCVETQSQAITIEAIPPIVDFAYDPPSGCSPLKVKFTNLSKFADASSYAWEFGSGEGTSNAIDPTYTYFHPGTFSVTLSATNVTGKTVTVTKVMIIEAFPRPLADFAVKPQLLYIPGDILYTSNRSFGASVFFWNFGDGSSSNEPQPQHTYKTEGAYDISLIATSINGCSDTTVMVNAVHVQKGGQVLIPNAFSPNVGSASGGAGGSSNGKNDIVLPLTRGVVEFELLVFNRWGELLFESRDPNVGWDGYYNGTLCAQDVYVYRLTAMYENGEKTVRVGDINLIR